MPQPLNPLPTLNDIRSASVNIRRNVAVARQHVGAAGLEQTSALERIIAVSREQASITRALNDFSQTLHQDRPHQRAAQRLQAELEQAGREHLELAQELDGIVALALREVNHVPLTEINAAKLLEIGEQVKVQIAAITDLIASAHESATPEGEQILQRIEAEVYAVQDRISQREAQGQVQSLGHVSRDAVAQIAQVEGASSAQQIEVLEDLAEQALQQVAQLKHDQADKN